MTTDERERWSLDQAELSAPERAMLDNAMALGFAPAPVRDERGSGAHHVTGVEAILETRSGTLHTIDEIANDPSILEWGARPRLRIGFRNRESVVMPITAALVSDADTAITEIEVIVDPSYSVNAIAKLIENGYAPAPSGGRPVGDDADLIAWERAALASGFGEDAERHLVEGLITRYVSPHVSPGRAHRALIESDNATVGPRAQ